MYRQNLQCVNNVVKNRVFAVNLRPKIVFYHTVIYKDHNPNWKSLFWDVQELNQALNIGQ
jgi:hypothetical protein